jgi:hypothetical protein
MPKITRRKFLAHGSGFGAMVLGGEFLFNSFNVRVGVVGLGENGRRHLRVLSQVPGAHVAAISDPDPAARRLASRLAPSSASAFADFRRILDRKDIDVVALAARPSERMQMIEYAADAGKHVVVDQPGVMSLKEAARLHALASQVPISIEHFPSDHAWDKEALLGWLSLDGIRRIEIRIFDAADPTPDGTFDELEIAARLLDPILPQRTTALASSARLSAEVGLGEARLTLHRSRSSAEGAVDRRVTITTENERGTASVTVDAWNEASEENLPTAAWSRAVAGIANGNRDSWRLTTARTAVTSAMVYTIESARLTGTFHAENRTSRTDFVSRL